MKRDQANDLLDRLRGIESVVKPIFACGQAYVVEV
jgi:hypothetical protein